MRGTGIFRSDDAGENWQELAGFPRLEGARLDCALCIPGAWLVGAAPGGVWLSQDLGQSWRAAPGTERLSVYALAAWPKDPRVLAAGTDRGVWLSHDGARTWKRSSPAANADLSAIVSVAFDPAKAGTIYAGTPHLPWKTADGGATWRKAHVGMYDDSDIFSIAVDPALPTRVFASACSGIYCSLNGGAAWRRAQGIPGTNRRTYVVAQDPHDGRRVFAGTSAGMWASLDQGVKWEKRNDFVVTSIAFHPREKDCFYASTERHGILRTRDAGRSFEERHRGFVSRSAQGVHATPDGYRVAGELERLGENWPGPQGAFDVRRDPFDERHLFAATPRGLETSGDGGGSWRRLDGGLGDGWIRSVAFHPKQKGRAFALRGQRVFWTRDGGQSWYWLPAQEDIRSPFKRLDILPSVEGLLFSTSEDRGVYVYSFIENPLE
jgi:photosystem II stability/assembly factor-like uncharacterized protein